ncbi:hypothetical protein [Ornithinibacillus xuwenensis]|uniref:Uncharacterized protein n=1 Tax=Ornithinibacillus xuwenensis TaxID=3144668 RepID=A0ABU9XC57_9BACI
MRKVLSSIAVISVLGIGGVLAFSSNGDTEKDAVNASSDVQEKEEVIIEPPTERTVDTKGDVPWKYLSAESVEAEQNNGEIVYLFSDAEALEDYTIQLSQNPDTSPYDKDTLSTSWANHMTAFIDGVAKYYPDSEQYFAKLKEAKNAMEKFNYEIVPKLIEEAKTLRESE